MDADTSLLDEQPGNTARRPARPLQPGKRDAVGKKRQQNKRPLTYKISRSKRYKTCSDVKGTVKIWAIEMSDRSSDRRR